MLAALALVQAAGAIATDALPPDAAPPARRGPTVSQSARADPPDAATDEFGKAARFFRFDEDYRFLLDQPRRGFPLSLKEIPIGGDLRLSIGGDYRMRVDAYASPTFGRAAGDGFASLQNRFLLHANLEAGPAVRVFVQLGAATEGGRRPRPRPSDRGGPDLVQGFVDYAPGGAARPLLRVGRQEFTLGRYVAVREGTNFRLAFDGVRAELHPGSWNLLGFAGRPVLNRPGAFDDRSGGGDEGLLLSADHPLVGQLRLQGVFIARRLAGATYAEASGLERRRTYSLRLAGGGADWSLDAQATYQEGSLRAAGGPPLPIRAGGLAMQAEWRPRRSMPRLGLRLDATSGDRARDGRIGTYDIPFPNLAYLTDATIFAPRNTRDVQPYVTVATSARSSLTLGTQILWRSSRGDALYNPANMAIVAPGGASLLVATQPYARASVRLSPFVNLQASYLHAFRGPVLREAGARRDLDFLMGEIEVRF